MEASTREADDGPDKADVESESSHTSDKSGVLDAQCQERSSNFLSGMEGSSSSGSSSEDEAILHESSSHHAKE